MILYNNLFENQEKNSMALFKKYFYINILLNNPPFINLTISIFS